MNVNDSNRKSYPTQRYAQPPPPVNMQFNQAPINTGQYPPQQSAAYPPQQPTSYPMMQNPIGGAYPPSGPTGPPPPYYPSDPYAQYPSTGYPRTMAPVQSSAYPPQTTGYPPQTMSPYPAGVQVTGEFDSSARFGAGASTNIPPPPPGVMPNAAQVAAMRGAPVQMQQRSAGWFEGNSTGGVSFW